MIHAYDHTLKWTKQKIYYSKTMLLIGINLKSLKLKKQKEGIASPASEKSQHKLLG